jgi:hypothetical protein
MNPEQRRMLADLLIEWEDLYRQGTDTPAETLCKDHPELASTLARQIAALKRVAWLDNKLGDDGDDPDCDCSEEPRPPKVLAGRYRLDELIATGGFAEVWRAFDQELQRIIAIKIPKKTVVGSAEAFLSEARRVARLKHPAILPVYDVGLEDGDCFFVSEFIGGGSLADRLIRGKVAAEQASRWILSIADALGHAHNAGVIHRDIKPANILIDEHDRALLTDFGIARSVLQPGQLPKSIGTLRYMSPEQLAGEAAVPQSDFYSLAVVLHEAVTGKPPYSSTEPNSLRHEITTGAVISKDLPARLVTFCRKALNKNPIQRHASAELFAAELRQACQPAGRWGVLEGLAAAFVVLAAIGFWRSLQPGAALTQETTSRHQRPSAVPPVDRMHWTAGPPHEGNVFFFDATENEWVEMKADGTPFARFRQTAITDEYVALLDESRNMGIRLWNDKCEYSCTNTFPEDVGILAPGYWTTTIHGPLPPRLYEPITLIIGRATFSKYLEVLSKATGIRITADKPALAHEGITVNQSVDLEASGEWASQYLDRLLAAVDPKHRLRLRSIQNQDGSVAVIVTTKKELAD